MKVTPELRRTILSRDGRCFMARLDSDHQCRDTFGNPHASTDLDRLTLEHVKDASMMGRRAPSDAAHLVALCGSANVAVPSRETRMMMRAYLKAVTT